MHASTTTKARYCLQPQFGARPQRETAAQANGRRYEEKAMPFLEQWAKGNGYEFRDHPWLEYRGADNKLHYCQPDCVMLSTTDDNMLIVEVKLRHTRDCVPQLNRYRGLLAPLHPEYKPNLIELCRYFDPDECQMELLPCVRPHPFPVAAVIFEPQAWTPAIN
jgi:hypothetical protein